MKRLYWFVGTAALAGIATIGWFGWMQFKYQQDLQALVEKTRANLIYVEGGSFEVGKRLQRRVATFTSHGLDLAQRIPPESRPKSKNTELHVSTSSFHGITLP